MQAELGAVVALGVPQLMLRREDGVATLDVDASDPTVEGEPPLKVRLVSHKLEDVEFIGGGGAAPSPVDGVDKAGIGGRGAHQHARDVDLAAHLRIRAVG